MAYSSLYTKNVRAAQGTLSAANTNRDGTGTVVTVWTATAAVDAANPGGSRIERVTIQATGTTTSGVVRMFISTDAAANTASNTFLYKEFIIPAIVPGVTQEAYQTSVGTYGAPDLMPIMLGPGQTLRFSTNNAEGFRVSVQGGDY